MTRILLLTDSLGLPRNFPETCSYEKTWPFLLNNEHYQIQKVLIGGSTSGDLLKQTSYHVAFNPDIVFVQVGIVDCVPRFMTKKEMGFIAINKYLEKFVYKVMARESIRNFREVTYTRLDVFEDNLKKIQSKFKNSRVFFIEIMPAFDGYEKKVKGIKQKVLAYNNIIKQHNHISTTDFTEQDLMTDFHHLTEAGNKKLYLKVKQVIEECVSSK